MSRLLSYCFLLLIGGLLFVPLSPAQAETKTTPKTNCTDFQAMHHQMIGQGGADHKGMSQQMMQNGCSDQEKSDTMPMGHGDMMHGDTKNGSMHGGGERHGSSGQNQQPSLPGQDAFGAIQEIVNILKNDPMTDWSSVKISTLREHLVDMNLVTLNAKVATTNIDGGVKLTVSGDGRTRESIQNMVGAHSRMIDGKKGWTIKATLIPDGAVMTATALQPNDVSRIRALGFFGLMTEDAHHQSHHLGIARGIAVHGKN